jgi:hypothetical protein
MGYDPTAYTQKKERKQQPQKKTRIAHRQSQSTKNRKERNNKPTRNNKQLTCLTYSLYIWNFTEKTTSRVADEEEEEKKGAKL